MAHDTEFMQRRLSVEQDNVAVLEMSLYYIPDLKILGLPVFSSKFQGDFVIRILLNDLLSTRVYIWSIFHALPQLFYILFLNSFGVCKIFGNQNRDCDLIDSQIRIRRNDSSTREVNTLSRKISSESTLFSFQSLAEAPNRFAICSLLEARNIAVDVHCNLHLEIFPLFHDCL